VGDLADWTIELAGLPCDVAGEVIGIADVNYIMSGLPQIAAKDIGTEKRPGEMAEVQVAVRIRRCARDDDTSWLSHGVHFP
jgi:hypothetical protein